jgi:hypothetical protein
MTFASVAKTSAYRDNLEDLKGIWYAMGDWVRQVRVNRENSRLEKWNTEHLAMLESRGGASYK